MTDEHESAGETQDCKYCGEQIKVAAKKCRHCGEFLSEALRTRQRERGSGPAQVPLALKIYGVIIMVLAGLGVLSGVLNVIAAPARFRSQAAAAFCVQLVVQIIILRLGLGLWRGQRSAVYGLCVIASLGVLAGLALMALGRGSVTAGLVVLGVVVVIYGPPIGIAFSKWKVLT